MTLRELEERGLSISRFGHWPGRHGDPGYVSDRGWVDDPQPTREETNDDDAR